MKILAIRGQNLASLARSFELDFVRGPMAGVGLFAITGPVGAGKSTLLDALCLPLFDRTPRLSGRGGPAIGDDGQDPGDWLRGNDPRSLLRRDAVEGHAEVDFLGRDRVRYRARWMVRRARRRPDGRLQEQELSLFDLDKQQFVAKGRRSEVLAAIELRLGLDFHQFCRSVLLAQGDFAAFLRASADERARLLENLTGADVYRRLSRAAHEGRKRREQQLLNLQAQCLAQPLLGDAERKALELRVQAATAELQTCQQGKEIARSYVNWYEAAAAHRQRESAATVDLQAVLTRHEQAAARRQLLLRRRSALPLVPRLELVMAAQVKLTTGIAARELAAQQLRDAEVAVAAAAHSLRTALATWWPHAGEQAPLVIAEFDRWLPTLQRWLQSARELVRREAAITQLRAEVEAAAPAVHAAAARVVAAEQAVRAAEQTVASATAATTIAEFAALPSRRRDLAAARHTLQRHHEVVAAWRQAATALTQAGEALAALQQQREQLVYGFAMLVASREQASQMLIAQRAAVEQARTRVGLVQFRDSLHAGQPCPLCGSTSHPSPVDAHEHELVVALRDVEQAETHWKQAQDAVVRCEAERVQIERSLQAATAAAAAADGAVAAARGTWLREIAPAAGHGVAFEQVASRLEAAAAAFAVEEAGIDRCADAADAAHRRRDLAATAEREARAAAHNAGEQHRAAQQRAATSQQSLDQAIGERGRAGASHDELTAALEPAFAAAPWQARAMSADGLETLRSMAKLARQHEAAVLAQQQARGEARGAVELVTRLEAELQQADEAFRVAFTRAGVQPVDVREVAELGADELQREHEALHQLDVAVERARAVVTTCAKMRREHEASGRPEIEEHDASQAYDDARNAHARVEHELGKLRAELHADDLLRRQRDELAPRLLEAERDIQVWRALDDLIGSSTGDVFAIFAQGLTLDLLLGEANRRLEEIARRYRLQRIPGSGMDFVVADLDLGGTRRSLQSLSGGETFLVSLALALALATLAAPRARVETLFLDEGFGTLDAQNLEAALGALDTLQASGCQVGVISHVDGIAERIGCVVEVRPEGGGQSRVVARVR